MRDFEKTKLYLDPPLLHSWDGGLTFNTGGLDKETSLKLSKLASKSKSIIETGSGLSTLIFLFQDNVENVTSISPDLELHQKLLEYSQDRLDFKKLNLYLDTSLNVLPKILSLKRKFDFFYIDGSHGLTDVLLDLYYCSYLLEENGIVVLDDVNLYSVKIAFDFLRLQPGYTFKPELSFYFGNKSIFPRQLRSAVFIKNDSVHGFGDWGSQPFVRNNSIKLRSGLFYFLKKKRF
jgi:hypothetical protein